MRQRIVAISLVALLCGGLTGAVGGTFVQQTGTPATEPTTLDSCTTITEPGRYVLASDVENSSVSICIHVRASDVVLDGNGHTIDGVDDPDPVQLANRFFQGQESPFDPETNIGVVVGGGQPLSNVTVTDLRVTNWRWGIVTAGLNDSRIASVNASGNGFGVAPTGGTDVTVVDSVASNNAGIGVAPSGVRGVVVRNMTASANGIIGVYEFRSVDATISDVTARENEFAGVVAAASADSNVVGVTATGSQFGVYLFETTGGTVTGAEATDNGAGVLLRSGDNSSVVNATANRNQIGVLLDDADAGRVAESTARRNHLYGVRILNTDDSTVTDTNASRNFIGVLVEDSTDSVVSESAASDQFAGFWVADSVGGAVVDNTARNTSFGSVYVNNSTGVRVANNEDGLPTFESTGDDVIGVEGGIRYDEEIAVNQSDGFTEDELRRYVYRAIARAEHLRQLEFTEPITLDLITRETLEQRTTVEPPTPPNQSAWENQFWEATFVVGEDANVTAILANESTQFRGSYQWRTNRLTIVSERDPPTISSVVLVHEFVHALQGQHFDVQGAQFRPRTEDALRARNGIVEGDASYVDELFAEQCGILYDCVQASSNEPLRGNVSRTRNFANRQLVLLPYSDGPQLIDELRAEGGWEAVNRAYEDLPESSEQIIHPDRRNEAPVPIEFEDTARNGWRQYDPSTLVGVNLDGRTTVGEAGIFTMFWYQGYRYDNPVVDVENHLVPNDAPFDMYNYTSTPSEGWGNDVLVPYKRTTPNETDHGYVWQTAWDTPRDARQFYEAYVTMLRGHDVRRVGPNTWVIDSGPFADAFRVVRAGMNVTIVNAPTVQGLAEIRPGVVRVANGTG